MSSNCGICGVLFVSDDNEQRVKCAGNCDKYFHSRCIQEDVIGTKTRSFRDWKCKNCRVAVDANIVSKALCSEELLKEMFNEMKATRTEINGVTESMQFLSSKMDESMNIMKDIKSELAAVKKENENLRKDNIALTADVNSLKNKVRALEQYSRKNNVEICGIPVTPNENVMELVKDVGIALGVEDQDNDVSAAHRVPSFKRDRPPALIVQFTRRTTRDALLTSFKGKKRMTAHQIHASFPTNNIYVNEHLSPENKIFLAKLKQKCKDVGYDYAWCRDGRFFVRKCQGDRYRRVENYEELDKLK